MCSVNSRVDVCDVNGGAEVGLGFVCSWKVLCFNKICENKSQTERMSNYNNS